MKPLSTGFSGALERFDSVAWNAMCSTFSDANLYQSWGYAAVRNGEAGMSHLLLKKQQSPVAVVQSRIVRAPFVPLRAAYVLWGPVWKAKVAEPDLEIFRQAVRALRNEYVVRRKMVLRLRPHLWEGEHDAHCNILIEEGFARQRTETRSRTIMMDLRPSLDELSRGLHQKWRNCLNAARKRGLEIIEGEEEALFEAFEPIHSEMQDRKRFVEGTSPAQYRIIQKQLRADEKMRVLLCKSEGKVCAGAIGSAIGDTGIYLFGATSNDGMKTGGSYLAQWKLIEWPKSRGCHWYNLNGINPVKNEGTYRFKSRLAGIHGREVDYLGQFDAYPNAAVGFCVRVADRVRNKRRALREAQVAAAS